jgi:hexosaminidase
MAPRNFCALDNYQDWDDSKLSKTMLYLPLDKIYKFNATDKAKRNILGSQANVDTKFIDNENKLTNQVYPRIFALAECFWTQKNKRKSFKDFSLRLEKIGYPGQITEKINLVKFK